MATALRRPIGHDDRLSLVEHLDELRSRLIVSLLALAVAFGLCAWQNGRLLDVINAPLDKETQKSVDRGRGPLGQIARTQDAVRLELETQLATQQRLARPSSGLGPAARRIFAAQAASTQRALDRLPDRISGSKPVTLGVGEPFGTTLTVSFYFAVLLALPFVLWQLYAFVLPAFSPEERRTALPLMAMVPVLFICGVVFGYFLVLPAAVRFLQNFNADEFNILVQARDYYKFSAITLGVMGIVFQVPVGILALTRLGVVSVAQLRANRRYAIVALAVLAMLLPGTDPVTMILILGPLLVLYELSILMATFFARPREDAADDAEDPDLTLS
jgi:sec-independent protein translocase protein TatC